MDSYIEFEEQEEYYKEHGLYTSTVKKLEQINNIDDKGERLEALKRYAKQQIEDAEIREANDAYTDGIDFDLINDLERENPED